MADHPRMQPPLLIIDQLLFSNPFILQSKYGDLGTTVFNPELVFVHILDAIIGIMRECPCSVVFKSRPYTNC